jgi:hypothetical protein
MAVGEVRLGLNAKVRVLGGAEERKSQGSGRESEAEESGMKSRF